MSEARTVAAKKQSLQEFMLRPEAKLMVSLLSKSENGSEVVRALIESAHDFGYDRGCGHVAMIMLEKVIEKMSQDGVDNERKKLLEKIIQGSKQ